jgi:hypothetical protein
MDITTLAAAQQSVKTLFGMAKVAASATVDHAIKDKLIEIQEGILDAQSKLGDAVAERLDLLHENAELREKVRAFEASKAALDGYVMHELQPGLLVYASRPSAGHALQHYACPRCFSGEKVAVLQVTHNAGRKSRWACSVCSFVALTGEDAPPPPTPRHVSWMAR